jgi:hypothetical protein
MVQAWALPSWELFTNATANGGTAYLNGAALFHQTNSFGEGWANWNGGGSGSFVFCAKSNLAYAGFPAAFPGPGSNAVYLPGETDHAGGISGLSAAVNLSAVVNADPNNLTTNRIYASFLLNVPDLGNLNSSSPIYFAGFATNRGDQNVALPSSAMKIYLKGNSSTAGQSTSWSIGVANNSGSGSAAFDGGGHNINDVLFVVVDHEFGINGGPDVARLWVNPAAASFGAATPPVETASTSTSAAANKIAQAADFFLLDRTGGTLWGKLLVSGLRLGTTWSYVTGGPEITNQPLDVLTIPGQTAVFNVGAVSGSPNNGLSYRWQLNGTNLANGGSIFGATSPTLTISNVAQINGGAYTVSMSNALGTMVSSGANLLFANSNAPVLLGAQSSGLSQVIVTLSQRLTAASATNTGNYAVSGTNGALTIFNASLDASQSNVVLAVSSMTDGAAYIVTVSNLANAFYPGSVIAPGSQTGFIASAFASAAVGNPRANGSEIVLTNGITLTSAGRDIGGTSDQFQFAYELFTGDFDVSVCLKSLSLSDAWAKAGLMARISLDAGSPFAATLATPAMAGDFFAYRASTNGNTSSVGRFPANYPNTWLRLKRAGNSFTGYASYEGQVWTLLASTAISMPSQIYLGLAASSHNSTQLSAAQFGEPVNTPGNATIATVNNPSESLGPSSRNTGIVISEIMYKPAPRTDGNELEFIELYNSQPFLHDISGYRLTCADMSYIIPPGTIMPGGAFLVVAASPSSIQNVYGITNVLGPYSGSLKKAETLQLLDEHGAALLTVPYSATYPWPVAALGTGHSIVLARPSYGEGDPRAWAISDVVGGSPGAMESFRPGSLRDVVINEILAHAENTNVTQYVELYNHSNQTNDLSDCILTDDTSTNKFVIPSGTSIAPRGFISFDRTQLGFAPDAAGGTIYFIKPDGNRILDAVQYEAQANGVALGRSPDGANDFYFLQTRTPGAANSAILIGDVVIDELMYKPISGNDDDQYVELYNRGANVVDLSGWQFTSGIVFTFPIGTSLAPNGYLVVARNRTNLLAKYNNLNAGNTLGNYSGKLSHDGERIALAQPQILNGTNTIYVVEDELTYGVGGRWGQWSSGGGSSLELIDPHSNHRLAANWTDSDETQKSVWTNIDATGVMDNGGNFSNAVLYAQIGLLDVGECLVDNIEMDDTNGVNYVSNPDFESGLGNWSLQGCMTRSSLENSGYASSQSLHIRSSSKLWTGDNSCQVALNPNKLDAGQTATLRFKARWLRGWPEVLLRMNGNWLEATGPMPIPSNLGTPGLPNSTLVGNAGPAICEVSHSPTLPPAGQSVVVTARAHDADGVQSLMLNYRVDPSSSYAAVQMKDDGTGGDAIASDGIYSATVPGQASGAIVAFYISAADSLTATTRFPALLNDNSPVRECLIRFGDAVPVESFGVYHLWCSQSNITRWTTLGDLSNESIDCTFVSDARVVYNIQARYGGSPYHQSFNSPVGNLCHYRLTLPDDDKFLGVTDFNRLHQPGNSPGGDASIQREQTAYTFMRALGVPWLYRRNVAVYVNGNRRGTLMEDTQIPNGDMVKEYFPNDSNGYLYKMQPWFEFGPTFSANGYSFNFINFSWCDIMPHTTAGGIKKDARYRYMFESRRTPDSASNFTNVYAIVDAASAYGASNYVAAMENLADMENWMRVFAANHAAANRDSFGATTAQNVYGYVSPGGTKYSLFMWDFNICLDRGAWSPGQNLFLVNAADLNITNIYLCPEFRRMYWRALEELIHGPLDVNNTAPLCYAKYNAFVADGLGGIEAPDSMLGWIGQAGTSIAGQLAVVNATAFVVNAPVVNTNASTAILTGIAPVNVKTISINGVFYAVIWTTLTNWTLTLPLQPGTNILNLAGVDFHGQPIAGDTNTVLAVNAGATPPPTDYVPYASVGSVYSQTFDSLPNPGATSVNADNPVTIAGITYSPGNPFCFAAPIAAGGLAISNMGGWYGLAGAGAKFGATSGDQTTGGDISFGLPNSSNRALGLLNTSSTALTAFGIKFINRTPATLNYINLAFTGEIWRQSNLPKTLKFFYFIDPSASSPFTTNATAYVSALDVNFPVVPADVGGVAVDGTASANLIKSGVVSQAIAPWAPGAALWLCCEMTDSTGKAQGLGIDNFIFSALDQKLAVLVTGSLRAGRTNFVLSWPALAGLEYQIEYTTNLNSRNWQPLGGPLSGNGNTLTVTNSLLSSAQGFYRVKIMP